MSEILDVLIIGAGPGGLAAAIYASRGRLNCAVLESGPMGGQAATTMELENYPGFFKKTTGPMVMDEFLAHATHFGTKFIKGRAEKVDFSGEIKTVTTKSGEIIKAKTVVLAPGAVPRQINVPGEARLRGKGVSYCATCDADFFEELDVFVVGSGNSAIEEAIYLTKFAENVTIVVVHDEGVLDANKVSAERAFANPKISFLWNSILEEILGDELVSAVIVKNIRTNKRKTIETNGVFVFIGTAPSTGFLGDAVNLDEHGYIITDDKMQTNIPGVFAVGDARQKFLRQVVTAAADGAIAAVSCERYLDGHVEGRLDAAEISKLMEVKNA